MFTRRAIMIALVAANGVAHAQTFVYTPSFDADPYIVTSDPASIASVESTRPLDHALSAGLLFHLGGAPLVVCVQNASGACATHRDLVTGRFAADLVFAIGFGHVGFHAQLPVTLHQGSDFEPATGMSRLAAAAVGDLRLGGKLWWWHNGNHTLGWDLTFSLPIRGGEDFVGNAGAIIDNRALYAWRAGRVSIGVNFGYSWHQDGARLANLYIDDEVLWAAGAELAITPTRLSAGLSVAGRIGVIKDPISGAPPGSAERPAEAMVSGRYWATRTIAIEAGAGAGLSTGYGTPSFRVLAGLRWLHRDTSKPFDPDPDGDGIPNSRDKCPNDPEDRDGFEDQDGCPELDDDHDGIADRDDHCPFDPEDRDGFEDSDGCPDPDNDGDGIPDPKDACPNQAGTTNHGGCPNPDRDGDGIADAVDKCPDAPEDKDGFQDDDGCPDPDNDGDGFPDAPANGASSQTSVIDKCPNEPEVFNGFEDDDGCPDKGAALVVVTATQIEITDAIEFDANAARLKGKSFRVLDALAAALIAHASLKVSVEGHTDDPGTEAANLDLSQKRADSVRDYLVMQGVDASRLRTVGFGRMHPRLPSTTAAARAQNRRVEFVIVP